MPSIEYKKWLLEQSKKILNSAYPDGLHINECSKEWVEKQVTTQGIVKYYSAYFSNKKVNNRTKRSVKVWVYFVGNVGIGDWENGGGYGSIH